MSTEKKVGHVCPPSKAIHPSDRWECLFVYDFILKYTNLRTKVEGFETATDFETALLSRESNPILTKIYAQFILNLRPQTRNLSSELISATVAGVLGEYFKTSERTVWWDEESRKNADPFEYTPLELFTRDWDFKLKVLRVLVELQLVHNPEIKLKIDRAWGVVHNKHKKKDASDAPLDPSDPNSLEKLQLIPFGQDRFRKRFWIVDDSPRIYISTNPWKISATFQTLCTTKDEYLAVIEGLKSDLETNTGDKKSKLEQHQDSLITALENHLEAIDAESARVQKVRRKIEQRAILQAQAFEIRETRTRRQTRRPDYAYNNGGESEEDQDEYKFQDEGDDDDDDEERMDEDDYGSHNGGSRRKVTTGSRRSSRNVNANGKRPPPLPEFDWRIERRSSRHLPPIDDFGSHKRAKTEESTVSSGSASVVPSGTDVDLKAKVKGAAAVKSTEFAVEAVAGKKKSKFWFYAVEPVAGAGAAPLDAVNGNGQLEINGNGHGNGHVDTNGFADNGYVSRQSQSQSAGSDVEDMQISEDSLSPPPASSYTSES